MSRGRQERSSRDRTARDSAPASTASSARAGTAGRGRVLVARLDDAGDVLLAGPAVRAVRTRAREVVFLAGPNGRAAAELLPGVDRVIVWHAPWIDHTPPPVTAAGVEELVGRAGGIDEAVLLTSFHQSALPLALLLRLAGVKRITAISNDYPGSLLDVRHVVDESVDVPEAERMLAVAEAAGFALPEGDDGKLAVQRPLPDIGKFTGHCVGVGGVADKGAYVVVHQGHRPPPARGLPTGTGRRYGSWPTTVTRSSSPAQNGTSPPTWPATSRPTWAE